MIKETRCMAGICDLFGCAYHGNFMAYGRSKSVKSDKGICNLNLLGRGRKETRSCKDEKERKSSSETCFALSKTKKKRGPQIKQNGPISPSTSLVKKHDNNSDADLVLSEKEDVKINQRKGNMKTCHRKRCKSSDSEENAEPIMVARQTSRNSSVHLFELSENEIGIVQPGEHATSVKVVENVLTEKTSSNCSNGDFACLGVKNITEIEKDVDLDPPLKEGNLPQVSLSSLEGPHVGGADKKLLILDVNGLLADIVPYCSDAYKPDIIISRKSVFKRPFCDDFLLFCFDKFNVGVWSSRTKKNVDMVIDFLLRDSRHKLLFCWHQSHCTDTGFTTVENNSKPLLLKELKKLWDKLEPDLPWNKGEYNESNTLLLDDSPYKALRNPAHTAIFPRSYCYKDAGDTSLGPGGDLRVYLEQLAVAQNVQEYVAQNPFGQRAITESNPSWGFYRRILTADSCQSQDFASSSFTGQ
ncbi:hypothetical protein GH714_040927 [Hevea brasiliensis]|uniref:Mitochondrial import inner membrane translocase subunit TIM50 n=1 Tax=Hevea brasiliensis TaxID=3981 RepID=A0A6A6MGN5_HEVBR|nr:hypothetical protein GH714_040927 [Hevea brasiliensis]